MYRKGDLLAPNASDLVMMGDVGFLPGVDSQFMGKASVCRWDKREEFVEAEAVDVGGCGEDEEGVFLSHFPETMLAQRPYLWPVFAEWKRGNREITETDYLTKSAKLHMAKLIMVCASKREELRRIRSKYGDTKS